MKKLLASFFFTLSVFVGFSQGYFDYGHLLQSKKTIQVSPHFQAFHYTSNDSLCFHPLEVFEIDTSNQVELNVVIDSSSLKRIAELENKLRKSNKIITKKNLNESLMQFQNLQNIVLKPLKIRSSTLEKLKNDKFRKDSLAQYLSVHADLELQQVEWNLIYQLLHDQIQEINKYFIDDDQSQELDQVRLKRLNANYKSIRKRIDEQSVSFQKIVKQCNEWNKTIDQKTKSAEDEKKEKAFIAQPEQLLSNNQSIPSIAVKGFARFKKNWLNEIIYFTGTDGEENEKDYLNFLLPNYSKHGILVNGFVGLDNSHSGLRYTANYQSKNFVDSLITDNKKVNLNFVQVGLGGELSLINDHVAIYGMVNFVRPLNNRDMFASLFQLEINSSFHFDGGIKFNLLSNDSSQEKGTALQLNLNFLRLIGPFEDPAIESTDTLPSIKVSFSKAIKS